jgi:hypothetical protein
VVAVGFGYAGVSRLADAAPSRGQAVTLQFGQSVGTRFDLIEEYYGIQSTRYSSDPSAEQGYGIASIGCRWRPFESSPSDGPPHWYFPFRRVDITYLYTKAMVGIGWRSQHFVGTDNVTLGPAAGFALGYLLLQGRDYAFGVEMREQVMHFDEGFQRAWGVIVLAELGR